MTRLATWNLVPSLPVVLRRIQNGGRQIGKAINRGLFHQGYQNDVILEFLSVYHTDTTTLQSV